MDAIDVVITGLFMVAMGFMYTGMVVCRIIIWKILV